MDKGKNRGDRIRILFVCHGNICRSTMAEFVMKQLVREAGLEQRFQIHSAATSTEELGADTHPGTKRVLTANGIPFARRQARQMTRADGDGFDLLIGMDDANLRNMRRICGIDAQHKIRALLPDRSIADPWYSGDFETTYADVCCGCALLLRELKKA